MAQISIEELELLDRVPHYVPVSATHLWGFDDLLEKIWQYVGMIRIYTKPRGQVLHFHLRSLSPSSLSDDVTQIPDYNAPVILHQDARSIEDFCNRIHKSILRQLKYANA